MPEAPTQPRRPECQNRVRNATAPIRNGAQTPSLIPVPEYRKSIGLNETSSANAQPTPRESPSRPAVKIRIEAVAPPQTALARAAAAPLATASGQSGYSAAAGRLSSAGSGIHTKPMSASLGSELWSAKSAPVER